MSNSLFVSALEGDFQTVKSQVELKSSIVKTVDDDRRTLLHWAGKPFA